MSELVKLLRKKREIEVKVGNAIFNGTRVSPENFQRYVGNGVTDAQICRIHISGWKGVKGSDIVEGGSKEEIPFDREDFDEVIGEKPEWYSPIVKELCDHARKRYEERVESEKK